MLEEEPLERHFGSTAGRYFRGVLESHGVEVRGGVEVEAFTGEEDRVEAVALAGGDSVPADVVVCGVGAIPDVMLARKSGLEIGDLGGVACDSRLRSATADTIYAAGDMCEYDSVIHGRVMRIEHEEVAAAQGATAARNMLGADVPHDEVPYFFSDLADWAWLEYVGPASDWDEEVLTGSVDDGAFTIFYLREGAVLAALTAGDRPGDLDRARELIRSGERVGAEGLQQSG
jgi:3-phenylpropionate/trans-cinnamate dioxygenase ferredoxin reductase subunit